MLKENSAPIIRGHRVLDIFLTAAAFIGAYFIKKDFLPFPYRGLITDPNYYVVLLMIVIIWYVVFDFFNLYSPFRRQRYPEIFWKMTKSASTALVVMILCMYVFKIEDVSRIMIGIFFLLNLLFLGTSKWLLYKYATRPRKNGFSLQNILIIGSKQRSKDVIEAIGQQGKSGVNIVGCLDIGQDQVGRPVKNGVQVIGTVDNLEKILREQVVDELLVAMPMGMIEGIEKYIAIAEEMGVAVRMIPDWQLHRLMTRPVIASIHFEDFFGIPSMALTTIPTKHGELLVKAVFDYLAAITLLIALSPILLALALAIKLISPGPILFRQIRSGLNGRRFTAYKFRTMVADAEARKAEVEHLNETDGPVFKMSKDPRIIPYLGTFLRRTGLDELPQLFNVLKGEMSIVGPRPPIPSEVDKYDLWQRRRLSMKPGMTCLWQTARSRNEVRFEDWMNLDLQYIDNWSLKLDFVILLRTLGVVFKGEGR
jgi:exopolysaccharide biosynthesis polyprenyl glycosylphosphotransferase